MRAMKLLAIPVLSGAAMLAACTSAQVEANITNACSALGSGLTAVGIVSALVPGGAVVNSTISQAITDVSSNCGSFATAVSNAVASVTSMGSSASVTVQAQTSSHKLATKYGESLSVHFTVGPNGDVMIDPKASSLLARLRGGR